MKRIMTAMIGIPLVIAVIHFAPHWFFALVVALFAGLCFNELMTFGSARSGSRPGIWTAVVSAAVTASFVGNASWVLTILAAAVLFCVANLALEGSLDSILPNAGLVILGRLHRHHDAMPLDDVSEAGRQDDFLDLGFRPHALIALDQEQVGVHVQTDFVGRRRRKVSQRHQRIDIDRDAQFLIQLPDQRTLSRFALIDLSARLHKTRRATLSDKKRAAIFPNEERGSDPQAR